MNGAESLVSTLVACGVEVCFTNPGTSEMHFVAALDKVEGMRAILGLFEGAVTGMADGYGRMKEKPAATLLHLGPGLANGLANLHNARRAATPIVNIVGDHATYHAQYDAPLASDITGFARPVSAWVHTSMSPKTIASDGARAVQAARMAPGQIATLILPADTAWLEADRAARPLPNIEAAPVSDAAIDEAAQCLRNGKRTAILMRGTALKAAGLEAAGRIKAKSGARLMCDTFAPRIARGAGRVAVERIPYFAEQIVEFLKDVEQLILVGAKPPVSFFAYPGKPSWCVPEGCQILYLAHPHEDGLGALEALAETHRRVRRGRDGEAREARTAEPANSTPIRPVRPSAFYLPEGAIVSDEAATSGIGPQVYTANAAPHDWLSLTGGSIGQGAAGRNRRGRRLPRPQGRLHCRAMAARCIRCRRLWTQAREKLDVTTVIFANRSYAILNVELMRVGAENPGPKALSLFDLHNPELNWVSLATGMGVEASRAETAEEFADQFASAMKAKGPRLIEVMI